MPARCAGKTFCAQVPQAKPQPKSILFYLFSYSEKQLRTLGNSSRFNHRQLAILQELRQSRPSDLWQETGKTWTQREDRGP
jgi:hypothetical protein